MSFITIVETDEAFDWRPTSGGEPMDSAFRLRIVPDDARKKIRKENTHKTFVQHRPVDELSEEAYEADLLDYAIVDWSGIKAAGTGEDVPCTKAMKIRLPLKWKIEIMRLCAAKEAGDMIAEATEEKKRSASISNGNKTNSIGSPVA